MKIVIRCKVLEYPCFALRLLFFCALLFQDAEYPMEQFDPATQTAVIVPVGNGCTDCKEGTSAAPYMVWEAIVKICGESEEFRPSCLFFSSVHLAFIKEFPS